MLKPKENEKGISFIVGEESKKMFLSVIHREDKNRLSVIPSLPEIISGVVALQPVTFVRQK